MTLSSQSNQIAISLESIQNRLTLHQSMLTQLAELSKNLETLKVLILESMEEDLRLHLSANHSFIEKRFTETK